MSGKCQAGGWRGRQTQAPLECPGKCRDCEITRELGNLPPHRNPWGTEIINLLISYTLLFPFFLEKKKKKNHTVANHLHIRRLCQSLEDKRCFGKNILSASLWTEMGPTKLGLLSPPFTTRLWDRAGHTENVPGHARFCFCLSTAQSFSISAKLSRFWCSLGCLLVLNGQDPCGEKRID